MALSTNSTGPDAPTDSTAIDGALGLGSDDQEIRNWLVSLSPSGASAYDTGWVAVTLSSGVTSSGGAWLRRIGKTVQFQASTLSFPSLASGGSMVLVDAIPAGFRTAKTARCGAWMSGGRAGIVGTDTGGTLNLWNQSGAAVTSAQVWLTWTTD